MKAIVAYESLRVNTAAVARAVRSRLAAEWGAELAKALQRLGSSRSSM